MSSSSYEFGLEVKLKDPLQAQSDVQQIKPLLPKGILAETWIDRNSILFFALKIEKITMGTFLSLSALITSFSIVTILYLLIMQKKQDIGIFLTMGMSTKKVKRLFAGIGLFLSGIGIFSGVLLGLGASLILQHYPLEILPNIYYDSTIPARVDYDLVLVVLAVSSLIAFVTSWIPSHRLARFSPVESIRKR